MNKNINKIYIGYDPKEHKAYEVLKFSLERISTKPCDIITLDLETIQNKMGAYRRKYRTDTQGQRYDSTDNRPFSSDFSFSRFLVLSMIHLLYFIIHLFTYSRFILMMNTP